MLYKNILKRSIRSQKSELPVFNRIFFSALSGLLLTGAFPNIGFDWLAWFALVPLMFCLRDISLKEGFQFGFITGLTHYLTLTYWVVYTMKTYGYLPMYLCIPVLFLLSSYLALYVASFSAGLTMMGKKPLISFIIIPVLWVSLEYIRAFLFSGFPWELLGYSQFNRLHIIQISDICGVYGVSFLIALSNSMIFMIMLHMTGKDWQGAKISKPLAAGAAAVLIFAFGLVWFYGKWRVDSVDSLISASKSANVTIVQGNIDQARKWDPAFRVPSMKKYIDMSLSAKSHKPDLIVWPETATPFYFLLHNIRMTEMVLRGIRDVGVPCLTGSPSFIRREDHTEYRNTAYLVGPDGKLLGKYDKVHLVPFGEYVPLKKWLPFLGKMVEHVGDFEPGKEGNTILLGDYSIGVQICYEIIFPNLSRAMAENNAALLVNITNDAWYGKTGAPYQHFSMTVFRAVENKCSLVRSANTGISGFIDPAGRIIASTDLFQDAVVTRSVPLIQTKTFYTRYGDIFAILCLIVTASFLIRRKFKISEKVSRSKTLR
ncbi:apolipoprotein N-acyltransferase [Desulfococcaceae bacterium HSG8]|nr:apolipoprotein N-acyltransferase [Desulfococcaceae bacterium HSG8]